jgi:hypothetical protein
MNHNILHKASKITCSNEQKKQQDMSSFCTKNTKDISCKCAFTIKYSIGKSHTLTWVQTNTHYIQPKSNFVLTEVSKVNVSMKEHVEVTFMTQKFNVIIFQTYKYQAKLQIVDGLKF